MRRQEALERINSLGAEIFREEGRRFWEQLYERREDLTRRFRESLGQMEGFPVSFRQGCRYLCGSFLWTELLAGRYRLMVQALGEGYMKEPLQPEVWVELEDFFSGLLAAQKLLEKEGRYFGGKISRWDLWNLIRKQAVGHFLAIAFLLRFQLQKEENQKEVKELIPPWAPRILRLGEYMGEGEVILFLDSRPEGAKRLKELLKRSFYSPFLLQSHFFGPDRYQKLSARERQLQYIAFQGCWLEQMDFSGSSLWGARFSGCEITGCTFLGADLAMARFENCRFQGNDWEEARFLDTLCLSCLPDGISGGQQEGILTQEEQYDRAIFLCGTGQDGQGLHPSGRV